MFIDLSDMIQRQESLCRMIYFFSKHTLVVDENIFGNKIKLFVKQKQIICTLTFFIYTSIIKQCWIAQTNHQFCMNTHA
jgi:hypothetical protein